jgi:hypothetical protein
MEGMEMSKSKLNAVEASLYEKFKKNFPDATEDSFLEMRKNATARGTGEKEFFAMHDVIMQEKPDADALREMHENDKSVS